MTKFWTKDEITLEELNDLFSLQYDTEIDAESNTVFLKDVHIRVEWDAARALILLHAVVRPLPDLSASKLYKFVNDCNVRFIVMRTYLLRTKSEAILVFDYDLDCSCGLIPAGLMRTLTRFNGIADSAIALAEESGIIAATDGDPDIDDATSSASERND